MRAWRTLMVLLVGAGCIFGGGGVKAEKWPERAAKETCDFSQRCAEANFFATYVDEDDCRAQNEAALLEDALESDGCLFVEDAADACLDALRGSCEAAGQQAEFLFEPCAAVWNCDGVEPDPPTDSGY